MQLGEFACEKSHDLSACVLPYMCVGDPDNKEAVYDKQSSRLANSCLLRLLLPRRPGSSRPSSNRTP